MKKWAFIYKEALKQNQKGAKFPIWGTCLGFESIVYFNSDYNIETTEVDSLNVNKKIQWIKKNYRGSYFERELRPSIAKSLTKGKNLN